MTDQARTPDEAATRRDYVADLGYSRCRFCIDIVRCEACGLDVKREGSIMRGHRRRCPVAPADPFTPGVCEA